VIALNNMPGFTRIYMFRKGWEGSGLGYAARIIELIYLALIGGGLGALCRGVQHHTRPKYS